MTGEIKPGDIPVCNFCGRSTWVGVAGPTFATFARDDCIELMAEVREETIKPRLLPKWDAQQ